MFNFYIPLLFLVLFSSYNTLNNKVYYHLNISEPLNIMNSPKVSQYLFYFEINPFDKYRVTLISDKQIFEDRYYRYVYTYECINDINNCYNKDLIEFERNSKYYTKLLFTISTNNERENHLICLFTFLDIIDIGHLYINVDKTKDYYIPLLQKKVFYDMTEYLEYKYYIIGTQRFQRIYINITTKHSDYVPLYKDYLLEYKNITNKNYIKKQNNLNYDGIYYDGKGNDIIYHCFDIDLGSVIALILQFYFPIDYMTIYAKTEGGAINFESNNITKTLTYMKRKNPYYFFTKTTIYQVSNITLVSKYKNNEDNIYPFKYVDIYEYKDKNEEEFIKKEEQRLNFIKLNNEQIITWFIYKTETLEITDLAFKFIPEYDLENVDIKINIKEFAYFLNDGEIKTVKGIYSGCELYFWIKIKIFQKLKINLRFNSYKINPINYFEFYEFNYHSAENNNYYNFINNTIIPDIKKDKELFESFIFTIENPKTNYALIKIKPETYLDNLEINANIFGQKYNLENKIPKNITNIKAYNPYYFFIEANYYNKLYIQLNISEEKEHFNYITINEYENANNITFIKSTNVTSDIIKTGINSNTNFIYIPKSPLTKCIALVLETNKTLDHLIIKIDVGGGYYEFTQSINISNIMKENIYYFSIKISPFKKMNMHIIMNNNRININAFDYLNIYETKNKNDSTYLKYFNQTLFNDRKKGQIIKYFSYAVDYFDTNYILIKIIPKINLDYMQLNYIITDGIYDLENEILKNTTKLKPDIPYYYIIKSKQYQQVNINFTTNYNNLDNKPFDLAEIFELENNHNTKSYNKYTYKSLEFLKDLNNNNLLISNFSYIIDSLNTNYIIIKIKPKYELDYLDIKFDVGGGFYELEKGSIKNITQLSSKYSYYLFTLSSQGDKLNFKLSTISNTTEKPFNSLDIYEYSNKNSPLIYLEKTNEKDIIYNKEDKLVTSFSYLTKNNSTNFIALKIVPKYNINSIECLIELEPKKETQKISLVMILFIILIIIFIGTTIIIGIYIKKYCSKTSSNSIENIYLNKEKINEKKFELALLPADSLSSSN